MTTLPPDTRINVPASAKAGEIVTIKVIASHPMETGDRRDASGARVAKHIVTRFDCLFEGDQVFGCDLNTGVSANPYFEFYAKALRSGRFLFVWSGDGGVRFENVAEIAVG